MSSLCTTLFTDHKGTKGARQDLGMCSLPALSTSSPDNFSCFFSLLIPLLGFKYRARNISFLESSSRQWQPTPVLLPGKFHGQRSLVGFSLWGCEESDTTEQLNFHFLLSCIGEGNGNPLQCSCWRIPGPGEPGGPPSMGSHRVGHG